MKNIITILFLFSAYVFNAQNTISLYPNKAPGSENWDWHEKEMFSKIFQTRVVFNVAMPSLTVYRPEKELNKGTAVVICPGGGFHTLSIEKEGIEVAKWLNSKGITAFVLKYRLVKSETDNPVKELLPLLKNRKKLDSVNAPVIPLAIADGLEAIKYVKEHAADYKVDRNRIGIMGFSAGGLVTCGVTFNGKGDSRPDFVAPIYGNTTALKQTIVPDDAPPMFIVAATDDELGLAPQSVKLYSDWIAAGKTAELHMYSKGGHGFGMTKKGLPVDSWIERFGDWLKLQGFM